MNIPTTAQIRPTNNKLNRKSLMNWRCRYCQCHESEIWINLTSGCPTLSESEYLDDFSSNWINTSDLIQLCWKKPPFLKWICINCLNSYITYHIHDECPTQCLFKINRVRSKLNWRQSKPHLSQSKVHWQSEQISLKIRTLEMYMCVCNGGCHYLYAQVASPSCSEPCFRERKSRRHVRHSSVTIWLFLITLIALF